MAQTPSNTVILGAGIIGVSTAYYLSRSGRNPPQSIHLVEASPTLFAGASGYAGGFVAKDWFGPSTASLGALSFKLHAELAEQYGGKERWGYSRSTGLSVDLARNGNGAEGGDDWSWQGASRSKAAPDQIHEYGNTGPQWLTRRDDDSVEGIGPEGSCAQVDPLRLCKFLLGEALEKGVRLHQPAKALSVSKDMRGELATIRIGADNGEETDLPCTRLIITAGPWSPSVFSTLFPSSSTKIPIQPLAGHSLVVKSPRWSAEHENKGCHAIFATDTEGFSPEIFSRIGGEIYIAGLNSSSIPLPDLATGSKPNGKDMQLLKRVSTRILGLKSGEDDLEVVREGLCFRPVTSKGPPIVARVPDAKLGNGFSTRGSSEGGVFLSAGHGPWGISQSLGTGKVLAELVEGKKLSADIGRLSI